MVGIIIANTGSPVAPTSDAVAAYLRRFLSDPRICPMEPHLWRFVLNRFVIPKRAPASAEKYASIWTDEGSPLAVHMAALARRLQAACDQGSAAAIVRHALCYSPPSMEQALSECREEGCDEVAIVPLYPQSAFSTTAAVHDQADRALARLGWEPAVRFVGGYSDDPAYVAAIASSIASAGLDADKGDRLLFAFHSIPMADVRAGDTYDEQAQRTARSVAEALGLEGGAWRLGYQCRFDKSRAWLGPSTAMAMGDLAGARRLFVVAPNFSVDCLETLYDIEVELRGAWLEGDPSREGGSFRYVPCLNAADAHVELVRKVVLGESRL